MQWLITLVAVFALGAWTGNLLAESEAHALASSYQRGTASTGDAKTAATPMSMDVVIETVEGWNARGDDWHFHRLHPTCFLNENQANWAIFLENTTADTFHLVETHQPDAGVKDVLFQLFEAASVSRPRLPTVRP